jgi:uncharacterized protein
VTAALHPRQSARRLRDGRLHLHDGPIDLVIEATGQPNAVEAAYAAATARFAGLLDELCAELPALRRPAGEGASLAGPIARTMAAAVAPYAAAGVFITPMAAVAGAVAQTVLAAMLAAAPLARAAVNDGGDIALHLAPGTRTTLGLVDRADFSDGPPRLFGRATLEAADPVRGVATSGRGGRSFSLGIADAVTVLARTAAEADAAATVIANAVDLPDHPGIVRVPARAIQPDSDLGDRRVTRAVPGLRAHAIAAALDAGAACADDLLRRGLIHGAALHLQGVTEVVGTLAKTGTALSPPHATRPQFEGGHADVRAHA